MSEIIVPAEGRQTEQLSSGLLVGVDGNAFAILGNVAKQLRRAGASQEYIASFREQATSGDYDHLLQTAMAFLDADPS